jgi:hypothetical protein
VGTARRIVGIHGINQHRRSPRELQELWSQAIWAGLAAVGIELADKPVFVLVYYADLLEAHRAEWKAADDAQVDAIHEPEVAALIIEWVTALDAASSNRADQQSKGELAGVPPTPQSVQWAVQYLAASPGLQGLGEEGVRRLARHLHAYLSYPEAREQIQRAVGDQAGPEPIDVLIGHSMGSVVAYEWLHRAAKPAGTLLTLGSPLGCAPVLRRIVPAPPRPGGQGLKDELYSAAGGTRWVNAAGRYDPIAWPKRLAAIFGGQVRDIVVPVRVNAHSIRTYLASEAVGMVVATGLAASGRP